MISIWNALLVCTLIGCSVTNVAGQDQMHCGFDLRARDWSEVDRTNFEETLRATESLLPRSGVTLPIVFHVVYRVGSENISDLQIRAQVEIVNRDFALLSDNIGSVPEEFRTLGADAGIRFCLASVDPNGNQTSGITRTMTQQTAIGTHQQTNGRYSVHYDDFGGKDGWDPNRYINVWVANMEGLLGSATFPGMVPFPGEDGVVIDPEFVGATGLAASSAPFDRGHTLTHEFGHYFGLYHIWGEGNGGCDRDDFVEDTPTQNSFYLGCPEYPQYSCSSSDMFMNFMDFTSDRCLALFTRGQVERMVSSLTSLRSTLLENEDVCSPPDSGKIRLDNALLFYAPMSKQILIVLESESEAERQVRLFSIDGRLMRTASWNDGSMFWLNTDPLVAGVYVVQLQTGDESISRKVLVTD